MLSLEEIHGERGLEKPAGLHIVEVDIERLFWSAVTTALPTSPNPSTSKKILLELEQPCNEIVRKLLQRVVVSHHRVIESRRANVTLFSVEVSSA